MAQSISELMASMIPPNSESKVHRPVEVVIIKIKVSRFTK